MNLFLRGSRGIGKSTLIDKIVTSLQKEHTLKIGGFMTFRNIDDLKIYITDAKIPRDYSGALSAGSTGSKCIPGVFDAYAERLILSSNKNDLLIFDELGFLEEDSPAFQNAVLQCLKNSVPVLGVLKDREVAWYQKIFRQGDHTVFDVTAKNRDSLEGGLVSLLSGELFAKNDVSNP